MRLSNIFSKFVIEIIYLRMKTTKILFILASVVMGAFLPACNSGGDSDYITTQTVPSCINIITNGSAETPVIMTDVSYKLDVNYTAQTADLYIQGLKTPDGMQYPELLFKAVPFTVVGDGWKNIHLNNVMPTSTSGAMNLPVFTDLNFNVLDRMIDQYTYFPCFKITYSVNGYDVVSSTTSMLFTGNSVVKAENADNGITYNEPYYLIGYNHEKGMAVIRGYNMKLNQNVYDASVIEMRNVPCTVDAAGRFIFSRPEAVAAYTSSGNPSNLSENANMGISNLVGVCSADNALTLNLDFSCPKNANPLEGSLSVTCQTPKF